MSQLGKIDPSELTYSAHGQPDIVLRVADMGGCPIMSRALLGAFYEENGSVRHLTVKEYKGHLYRFVRFLADRGTHDSVDSLNAALLREYRKHLADSEPLRAVRRRSKNRALSVGTQRKIYGLIERYVISAARLHGKRVDAEFNPFPGGFNADKPIPKLSPIALIRILVAAKREARDAWVTFESRSNLDPTSPLGKAVAFASGEHGGIWPTNASKQNRMLRTLAAQSGGVDAIARRLHLTVATSAPYLILLAYETVANAYALIEFPEDCVSQDPLFDTRSLISWDTKRRSKFTQSVSRDHRGAFSAPALVAKLRALRENLVPHAASLHRRRLFLVRNQKMAVLPLSKSAAYQAVQDFMKRNHICEEDGSPVTFTLDMMRPSVLAEVYRRTQDLLVAFRLAGHVDVKTTIRYVIDRATDDMHDSAIADVQDALAKTVRAIGTTEQRGSVDLELAWPGNERDCKDPRNGEGPFAKRGQICPTWFFPYNHSGLVIPNEVRYVTTIMRQKRQLEEMREVWLPARFNIVCEPVYRIIVDEIIPSLEPCIINEAMIRASELAPLPVFPDV